MWFVVYFQWAGDGCKKAPTHAWVHTSPEVFKVGHQATPNPCVLSLESIGQSV